MSDAHCMTDISWKIVAGCLVAMFAAASSSAAEFDTAAGAFFQQHCADCHDATAHEGGLDLFALSRDLTGAETLRRWVRIYDRIAGGEMPPPDAPQPDAAARHAFLTTLQPTLIAADRA